MAQSAQFRLLAALFPWLRMNGTIPSLTHMLSWVYRENVYNAGIVTKYRNWLTPWIRVFKKQAVI
jgi:hypothetical protein